MFKITICKSQGKNHQWLLGNNILIDSFTSATKARLLFDSVSVLVIPENRKLPFSTAQANVSDENGNLLLSTNGCWIANANGDTLLNGSGLNPSPFTTSRCNNTSGLPYIHADILLQWPGDTSKYVLFHQTSKDNSFLPAVKLFYTIIDMSLDSGLGGIDSTYKNLTVFNDTLSMGIAACKHANGRDWWIIVLKDGTDIIYKILLSTSGIVSISTQQLGVPPTIENACQTTFSPDGNKFVYSFFSGNVGSFVHDVRLFDFDRCSGIFSNPHVIDISDSFLGFGLAFSPNNKYLYASSSFKIFQINIDSLTVDTVAYNDGYASPNPPLYTDFWTMYNAANGKIYISTGNSTIDLHYINQPDSAGIGCDVQQHALHLPCYAFRADVNHPNYYLGPVVGSACDTLTGMDEHLNEIKNFTLKPNPNNGSFSISYLLPQNKSGMFEVYDVMGRRVFKMPLPPWSTLQQVSLPKLSEGVYSGVVTSYNERVSRKIVIMNN